MSAQELLDAMAEHATAPARVPEVRMVLALAAARRRRRRVVSGVGVLAAAAAALMVVAMTPWGVRLAAPSPAAGKGPGSLPDHLVVPPAWVPSVAEAPITRAALAVIAPDPGSSEPVKARILLVGADGEGYRSLPGKGLNVSLSPDGRRVAWYNVDAGGPGGGYPDRATARWLQTSDGEVHSVRLRPLDAFGVEITDTTWSPDGRRLAIETQEQIDRNTSKVTTVRNRLWLLDTESGSLTSLCRCGSAAFDASGRLHAIGQPDTAAAESGVTVLPTPQPDSLSLTAAGGPLSLLAPDGGSMLAAVKRDGSGYGPEDDFWLQQADARGLVGERVPLGRLTKVRLLARTASQVWVEVHGSRRTGVTDFTDQGQVWRVDLVTGARTTVLPVRGTGPVGVLTIATDIVAGGQVSPARWQNLPWWHPAALRHQATTSVSSGVGWSRIGSSRIGWLMLITVGTVLVLVPAVRRARRHRVGRTGQPHGRAARRG